MFHHHTCPGGLHPSGHDSAAHCVIRSSTCCLLSISSLFFFFFLRICCITRSYIRTYFRVKVTGLCGRWGDTRDIDETPRGGSVYLEKVGKRLVRADELAGHVSWVTGGFDGRRQPLWASERSSGAQLSSPSPPAHDTGCALCRESGSHPPQEQLASGSRILLASPKWKHVQRALRMDGWLPIVVRGYGYSFLNADFALNLLLLQVTRIIHFMFTSETYPCLYFTYRNSQESAESAWCRKAA